MERNKRRRESVRIILRLRERIGGGGGGEEEEVVEVDCLVKVSRPCTGRRSLGWSV